jgi:hypothetical protein
LRAADDALAVFLSWRAGKAGRRSNRRDPLAPQLPASQERGTAVRQVSLPAPRHSRASAVGCRVARHCSSVVRTSRSIAAVERLAFTVLAVLIASRTVGGSVAAPAVTVCALGVLLVLLLLGVALLDKRRRLALDLIIEGQDWLPISAVARQRSRLAKLRSRRRLARGFERVFEEGLGLGRLAPGPLPMVRPAVAAAVLAELGAVGALLRSACPGIRGVALAERLLIDGASPLYGQDVAALREQLGRASLLLRA